MARGNGQRYAEPLNLLVRARYLRARGESQDSVAMLPEGGVMVAVVEPDFGGPAVDGRQEGPVVDELSH